MARNNVVLNVGWIALFMALLGGHPPLAQANSRARTAVGTPQEVKKVWVKRPDGSLSCDAGHAKKPGHEVPGHKDPSNEDLLKKEQITVYEFKKTNDGQMRAAVCGIPTGNEDSYLISDKDLSKAKSLGFTPVLK